MISGKTTIPQNIANNVQLFAGREGVPTFVSNVISPVSEITKAGQLEFFHAWFTIIGTGTRLFFIVPVDEFWTLKLARAYLATGSYTISDIIIWPSLDKDFTNIGTADPPDDKAAWEKRSSMADYPIKLIPTNAGQTELNISLLHKDVRLMPKTQIGVVVDAYTSTGILRILLYVAREVYNWRP